MSPVSHPENFAPARRRRRRSSLIIATQRIDAGHAIFPFKRSMKTRSCWWFSEQVELDDTKTDRFVPPCDHDRHQVWQTSAHCQEEEEEERV
jgi:hypothetical protein